MTEENTAEFRREGENPFEANDEKDNSNDSPPEETKDEIDPAPEGEKTPDEKEPRFNEHPRWKERETEWTERFNQQEVRHREDISKLRDEFGGTRKENAEQTKIPAWFGGNKEAWDAYRADRDVELQAAEERAFNRIAAASTQQERAVAEATAYMTSEIASIEQDATLNPTGEKIDAEALLKTVLDNDLIDSKGSWNYKAGYRMMKAGSAPAPKKVVQGNKELAGALGTDSKGEKAPQPFKTSADFKKNKPW